MRYDEMMMYVEQVLKLNNAITTGNHTFRNRFEHSKRVYYWARKIADDFPHCNKEVLFTSAIFHDIGYALGKENHAKNGAEIFKNYATEQNYEEEFINEVYYCVLNHSNKEMLNDPNTKPELILLMEADWLDEEGALAVTWDILSCGITKPTSFNDVFEFLYKYSKKILAQEYMVTPIAKKIWLEKQKFVKNFIETLEGDLFVNEVDYVKEN